MIKLSSEEEVQMWQDWRKEPTKGNWQKLYRSFKPVMVTAMKKNTYGSKVPYGVHFATAVDNFDRAIKTYRPDSATKLSSWIHTNVNEKGKRVNAKYSNIGFIPESRYFKVTTYKNAVDELTDSLGREPATTELADYLGWSQKAVAVQRRELRKDFTEDEMTTRMGAKVADNFKNVLDATYHELSPQQQVVYEHMRGTHGRGQAKNIGDISTLTGIPNSQIANIKTRIIKKIKELNRGFNR